MMKRLSLALVAPALVACGDDAETSNVPDNADEAVANYAAIVHASYADSITAANDLKTAVDAFIAAPSDTTLAAAREAWLDAREPYLQTEVYRFYDGPIDEPEADLEPKINAWPMDEAYLDYVEGDATAGIINDTSVDLTAEGLLALNFVESDENIATGWHAIEFMLWGQDLSADGPGARPFTDYTTAANADRRKTYLGVIAAQLVDLLETVDSDWIDGGSNYRAELVAASPQEGLRRILTGMITLSGFETGGERIEAALATGSQDDEHSCFSDNTHRDMIQDVQGVWNVWHGEYTRLDGTKVTGVGIRDVVAAVDADLSGLIDANIDDALAKANAMQPPFDREIANDNTAGRARVSAVAESLRALELKLQSAFRLFDLSIPVTE